MRTEIVHSTKAPVVPSTPIDAPSAAIRNPGFASATTKPSHHVIALRSCLSSTSADAIDPPSPKLGVPAGVVPIGTAQAYGLLPRHPDAVNLVPIAPVRAEPGPSHDAIAPVRAEPGPSRTTPSLRSGPSPAPRARRHRSGPGRALPLAYDGRSVPPGSSAEGRLDRALLASGQLRRQVLGLLPRDAAPGACTAPGGAPERAGRVVRLADLGPVARRRHLLRPDPTDTFDQSSTASTEAGAVEDEIPLQSPIDECNLPAPSLNKFVLRGVKGKCQPWCEGEWLWSCRRARLASDAPGDRF